MTLLTRFAAVNALLARLRCKGWFTLPDLDDGLGGGKFDTGPCFPRLAWTRSRQPP
jgi:hypothetical protein